MGERKMEEKRKEEKKRKEKKREDLLTNLKTLFPSGPSCPYIFSILHGTPTAVVS